MLGKLLIAEGALDPDGLQEALDWQVLYGGRLGTNLLELRLVEEEALARVLGKQHGCEVAFGDLRVSPDLIGLIPRHVANREEIVPWKIERRRLKVLCALPQVSTFDELAQKLNRTCVPVIAPEYRIVQLLRREFGAKRQMRALDFGVVPEEQIKERRRKRQQAESHASGDAPPELIDEAAFNDIYNQVIAGRDAKTSEGRAKKAAVSSAEASQTLAAVSGATRPPSTPNARPVTPPYTLRPLISSAPDWPALPTWPPSASSEPGAKLSAAVAPSVPPAASSPIPPSARPLPPSARVAAPLPPPQKGPPPAPVGRITTPSQAGRVPSGPMRQIAATPSSTSLSPVAPALPNPEMSRRPSSNSSLPPVGEPWVFVSRPEAGKRTPTIPSLPVPPAPPVGESRPPTDPSLRALGRGIPIGAMPLRPASIPRMQAIGPGALDPSSAPQRLPTPVGPASAPGVLPLLHPIPSHPPAPAWTHGLIDKTPLVPALLPPAELVEKVVEELVELDDLDDLEELQELQELGDEEALQALLPLDEAGEAASVDRKPVALPDKTSLDLQPAADAVADEPVACEPLAPAVLAPPIDASPAIAALESPRPFSLAHPEHREVDHASSPGVAATAPASAGSVEAEADDLLEAPHPAPVWDMPSHDEVAPADTSPLAFAEALRMLNGVTDRDAIAHIVLRCARGSAARALLLTVQGGVALGWDGLGEGLERGAAQAIAVPLAAESVFKLVVSTRSHYLGAIRKTQANIRFLAQAGKKVPLSAVLLPILFRGRVSHLLYLDNGHRQQAPTDIGEMLILAQKVTQTVDALVAKKQQEKP